jgi:predicted N-acyltransferase
MGVSNDSGQESEQGFEQDTDGDSGHNSVRSSTNESSRDDARLELCFHTSLSEIDAFEWNNLAGTSDPFTRYEFLSALETHNCVGQEYGWYPYHLAIRDSSEKLIGACPLYIKTNSYGEFVFDWSWASAYEQSSLEYYPKIVSSIPYNPVSGARLLAQSVAIKKLMVKQIIRLTEKMNMSGSHILFTTDEDTEICQQLGMQQRIGCQYHWKNKHYTDFEDFISTFVSRKRKKVKRERRKVAEENITFIIKSGDQASTNEISKAHHFYESTFDRKSGLPTLSKGFFKEIALTMGEQLIFIFAMHKDKIIACAICFKSDDALFGRFWGCESTYDSLHFETCFYQGIEYCIQHKLQRFEPGAQGEHKITRGFLPTITWSSHWIANQQFREPIYSFCEREKIAMREQYEELMTLSPYRSE